MLKAIKKSAKKINKKLKILGVTVLTSFSEQSLKKIGHTKSIKNLVIQQAKLAAKANLDAFVCSAHEVPYVKPIFKKEIITPGIRLNTKFNDQKRVTTPNDAFKKGSSWLVIGRSLTKGNIKNNIKRLINHRLVTKVIISHSMTKLKYIIRFSATCENFGGFAL